MHFIMKTKEIEMSNIEEKYLLAQFTDLNSHINAILKSTSRIKYTCFDVSRQYIIFGSTSGGLYIFNRSPCHFVQLVPNQTGPINQISISPNEDWLAFSTQSGLVYVIRRPAGISPQTPETQISYEHEENNVTALKWDDHNSQLFIGDDAGRVSVLNLHYLLGKKVLHVSSFLLFELNNPIVQLDVSAELLLVSSTTKTVLCNTQKQEFQQVGLRPRHGKYGACFATSSLSGNIYCARPGQRLWEVDLSGTVLCTHKFRDMLIKSNRIIQAFEDIPTGGQLEDPQINNEVSSINFTVLSPVMNAFILTFNSDIIYILNPSNCEILFQSKQYSNIENCVVLDNIIYVFSKNRDLHEIHLMTVEELIVKCYYMQYYYLCACLSRENSYYLVQRMKQKGLLSKLLCIKDTLTEYGIDTNIDSIFTEITVDNYLSEESSSTDDMFDDEILYKRHRSKPVNQIEFKVARSIEISSDGEVLTTQPSDNEQSISTYCPEVSSTSDILPDSSSSTNINVAIAQQSKVHTTSNIIEAEICELGSMCKDGESKDAISDILDDSKETNTPVTVNFESNDRSCINTVEDLPCEPLFIKSQNKDVCDIADLNLKNSSSNVHSGNDDISENSDSCGVTPNHDVEQQFTIPDSVDQIVQPDDVTLEDEFLELVWKMGSETNNAEETQISKEIDDDDFVHLNTSSLVEEMNQNNNDLLEFSNKCSNSLVPITEMFSSYLSINENAVDNNEITVIQSLYTVIKETRQNQCTIPERLPILVEYDSESIINIFRKLQDYIVKEEEDSDLADYECSKLFLQFITLRLDILDSIDTIREYLTHCVIAVESRRSKTCVCGYPVPQNVMKPLFYGLCKKIYNLLANDVNKRMDLCAKIPYLWHLIVDKEIDPSINKLCLIIQLDYKKGFEAISKSLTADDYINIIDYKLTLNDNRCLLCFSKFDDKLCTNNQTSCDISWNYIGSCMYRSFGGAKTLNLLINKSNEIPQGSFALDFYHFLMLNP